MSAGLVKIPVSLLRSRELTASMKLVWMQLEQDAELALRERLSPSRIKKYINVARDTVRKSISKLVELGWYSYDDNAYLPKLSGECVYISELLLVDDNISTQAKVMYVILQTYAAPYKCQIEIKYSIISQDFGLDLKGIRKAIEELVNNGWLTKKQTNIQAPIILQFYNPKEMKVYKELVEMRQRIDKAEFKGQALLREILSLIISSKEYQDNAMPSFLTNPFTGSNLQYDRYYEGLRLAFEFNGIQHYEATDRYPREIYRAQRGRDLMKYGFSSDEKIKVVVIKTEELSFAEVSRRISRRIKRNDLRDKRRLIMFIERCCEGYRRMYFEAQSRAAGQKRAACA